MEATPGATGQFDVFADGELIFSKKETGRFPEEREFPELMAAYATWDGRVKQ